VARCRLLAVSFVAAALFAGAGSVRAQDTTAVARDTAARDTTALAVDTSAVDPADAGARRPPVGPGGAFLRSLLVPGLGQVVLGRKVTAVVFVAFEGATVAMAVRAHNQVKQARLTDTSADSSLVTDKKRSREDWLVLVGFNHLLAGLEAYVAAHLWDFPADLQLRAVPGGVGAAVTIPFRLR
jgi:hypothetical protein